MSHWQKPPLGALPEPGYDICRGLVGLWLFNEGSGGRVFDISGNGNHGTLVADTHFVPGKFGSALDFDGTGDYVNIPISSPLQIFTQMTFLAWTKNIRYFFEADGEHLSFFTNDSTVYYIGHNQLSTETSFISGPDATDGNWHQIGFTWDGTNFFLYVNAVKITPYNNPTGTGTIDLTGGNLTLGYNPSRGGYSTGQNDHVMIFNRALSASEIAQLYREPFCMFERDPIELWSAATLGAAPPAGMAGAMTTNTGYWGW